MRETRMGPGTTLAVAVTAFAFFAAFAVQAREAAPVGQAAGAGAAGGQAVWVASGCGACHGDTGRGTAAAPALAGTSRSLPDFIAYVRTPAGTMPPTGAQAVSDQALGDIHAFLRAPIGAAAVSTAGAPPGRVEAGADLYRRYGCFQCHSNEGQGGTQGPRLGPDPVPYTRFAAYVRNPANDMPPYTEKVASDQDLADIYAFLVARPRPPAVATIPLLAP